MFNGMTLGYWLWWVHVVLLPSLHRSRWKCTSPEKRENDEHMGSSKSSWGWNHQKKTQSTMYPVWWTLQFGRKTWNLKIKIKLTTGHWSNVKLPDVENVLSSHKVLSPEILPERSSPAETASPMSCSRRSLPKVPTCSWESQKHHEVLGQDNKKWGCRKQGWKRISLKKSTCTVPTEIVLHI